jgi:excisionase family DNA binding protein
MPAKPSRIIYQGRQLISLAEAAELADVSIRSIRRYVADGRLEAVRVGPRLLKIDTAEVEKLIRPVTVR